MNFETGLLSQVQTTQLPRKSKAWLERGHWPGKLMS